MYATLTKKRLFLILCATAIAFVLIGQIASVKANDTSLSTNEQRVQYIETLGIRLVNDEFKEKGVTIPQEFSAVYENYNSLQQQAGFDLKGYCGKKVTVYTYVSSDGKTVNLIIYKDKLIGGDISEPCIDGEMTALKGKEDGERTF